MKGVRTKTGQHKRIVRTSRNRKKIRKPVLSSKRQNRVVVIPEVLVDVPVEIRRFMDKRNPPY